jgi:hypothetical protein
LSNESDEFIRICANVQAGTNSGIIDKITVIFSAALPAVCVKNEDNWHIKMQFLNNETRERSEVSMIDTPM